MAKGIYLIVAPSGAGKTTLTESLEQHYGLKPIQSYTTRPIRTPNETGHTFISDKEFDKLTDLVAYTEYHGYRYAATAEQVDTHDLYVIDPKGVDFFKECYKGNKQIKIVYIDSSLSTRYERMKKRWLDLGDDFSTAVDKTLSRIKNDIVDFYDYVHNMAHIDFIVHNDKTDTIEGMTNRVYEFIRNCEQEYENQEVV